MSYTMYTPLNVWLDPASVTDVVAYIQTYLRDNPIYSTTEIETLIHDYLIVHPELIGGVQSVNGKTGNVVLSASDINTENNVTIESVLSSLSSQISSIAASVATNTANITSLTGRVSTAETDLTSLKSSVENIEQIKLDSPNLFTAGVWNTNGGTGSSTSTTRIRTELIRIPQCDKLTIECPTGFKVSYRLLRQSRSQSNAGLYSPGQDWKEGITTIDYPINDNLYMGINYSRSDDSAIASSDINALTAPIITIYGKDAPALKTNHTKILLIGNSKSQNSSDYLNLLLGINNHYHSSIVFPFHGGVSLQDHYDNRNNSEFYTEVRYFYNYQTNYKNVAPMSLTQIIENNPDITHVIFQQNTENAATASTYSIIDSLIGLFGSCHLIPKFYIMATWKNDESIFSTDDILNAVKTYAESNIQIFGIIPTGSAIEKAKANSFFASKYPSILYDGVHLADGLPRRLASLMIIKSIYGLDQFYIPSLYTSTGTPLLENLCYQIAKETYAYTV